MLHQNQKKVKRLEILSMLIDKYENQHYPIEDIKIKNYRLKVLILTFLCPIKFPKLE